MEGLERRQLLAAEVFLPAVDMPELTGPRNVGAAQSFTFNESEQPGELGENDNLFGADFIPLGTGPGQQDTIDITGTLPITAFPNDPLSFRADLDTYAFTLKRGDILDIAVQGAAGTIDVDYEDGTLWFATDIDQGGPGAYPPDSPLQTIGNAIAARVVPEDGTYYLTVSPIDTTSTYQVGLRTYRPIVEELPIGSQQVIFLDLDGGRYSPNNFTDFSGLPLPGVIRVPSLRESLPLLGIEELNDAAFNRLVDLTVAEVERQFAFLGTNGNAGDYDRTGNPGDYGVMILNSRDHADPGFHPLVTRVLIGGPASNGGFPAGLFGISPTLDVGNFSMDDIVLTVLDSILPTGVPMSPAVSEIDAASDLIALTISHELGHSFGLRHTERANTVVSIIDANVDNFQDLGAGPDLIYGTIDDVNVDFVDDRFSIAEGYIGVHRVLDGLANTLITGTAGVAINGRVFSDVNRDGIGVSDSGLSGVFVFADINGNGIFEPSEPSSTSGANGNFTLSVRPGTFNVIAVTPDEFAPTTPTTVSATPGVAVNFGFNQVIANITGTVFVDNDGDGVRSATDSGLPGVFVYIDLDGDNRPDLGEPNTDSGPDGSYVLNFPGPGTFTIRDVVPAGFEQSFPASGEHTVTFDGFSLGDNFNFGLLPSQDFGDAPDSYGTTLLTDGARHGITGGLNIGATIDREVDGQPSAGATGDDFDAQGDDEDGVRLLSPLGPGATATFELTATNTTGAPAFIQAFMDFDGDGTFAGPGEQFVSDVVVSTGTLGGIFPLTVAVPAGTAPGTTFARFRLSGTSGLGATGFATSGEVEDYSFPKL